MDVLLSVTGTLLLGAWIAQAVFVLVKLHRFARAERDGGLEQSL